jgi:hypothetical protein
MQTIQQDKVDRLGALLAQIADLEEEASALKDALKNGGEGAYEGALFRAMVTLNERRTVDNKAVFKAAGVPQVLIDENTRTTAVITIKVTSR